MGRTLETLGAYWRGDIYDEIADKVWVEILGYLNDAVEDGVRTSFASAFRDRFAQRTCATCRHGRFGRDYNDPLAGNLVTGYSCEKRVEVDDAGNPPSFSCSLYEKKS